jgi:hypothetical protein
VVVPLEKAGVSPSEEENTFAGQEEMRQVFPRKEGRYLLNTF